MVVVVVFKAETFWNLDRRDKTLNAKESSFVYLYLFCVVQSSFVGQTTKKIERERERGPFILSEKKYSYVNVLCGQEYWDDEKRRDLREFFDFFFLDLRAKNFLFEGISMSEKDEREKKKISFFFVHDNKK